MRVMLQLNTGDVWLQREPKGKLFRKCTPDKGLLKGVAVTLSIWYSSVAAIEERFEYLGEL